MTRANLRILVATLAALSSAACALGGQTYDDGSDEVSRQNTMNPTPDAGDNAPAPTQQPQPGPEPAQEPASRPEPASGPEPAQEPDPALTCDQRTSEVHEEIDAVVAGASVACNADEDCLAVRTNPSCVDSCPMTAVASVEGVAAIQAELAQLDESVCQDFFDAGCVVFPSGCPVTSPHPLREPRCSGGQCMSVEPNCEDLSLRAKEDIEALVAELDRSCTTDDDCVAFSTAPNCADICGTVVLANTDTAASGVEPLIDMACEPTLAAGCASAMADCALQDPGATTCSMGQCIYGTPAATDCYGPEQNVDLAYSGTLEGCACGDLGDVCIGPVALICEEGTWRAVEDGPCDPALVDQGCDGRIESPQACVELFDTCAELSTGLFCGSGRRTSLCDDGELVEASSGCVQDASFCVELEDGLYCTGSSGSGPISAAECAGRGGEVFADPGDGSFTECLDGRATLAQVEGCIEGCLCCGPQPGDEP